MKKQNGGVKLITLVAIVIVLTLILFTIVFIKHYSNKNGNVENQNTINTVTNNIANDETNELQANEINEKSFTETKVNTEISDLDLEFLKLENNSENLIYSPLSIKYGLNMLKDGANGNTKTQIEKVIGNNELSTYKNIENAISIANSLFIRDSYSEVVKKDYTNLLKTKYNAEIKLDPFTSATPMNSWVEKNTFGQIKYLLKDETIANPNAKMVLINALAIDMKWDSKFDEGDTNKNTFYLEDGTETEVDMMHQTTSSESVSYYKNNNVTALSMDYEKYGDTQLECIAIMPSSNLNSIIKNINADTVNKIYSNLKNASTTKAGVSITIPKFEYDYELNFKNDLTNLGIKDAFNESTADFTNMAYKEKMMGNLYVEEAVHKAKIKFFEKGTKAAAATAFVMYDKNALIADQPIIIKFDKPFLYIIRDKQTHDVWFVGTIYNPSK